MYLFHLPFILANLAFFVPDKPYPTYHALWDPLFGDGDTHRQWREENMCCGTTDAKSSENDKCKSA